MSWPFFRTDILFPFLGSAEAAPAAWGVMGPRALMTVVTAVAFLIPTILMGLSLWTATSITPAVFSALSTTTNVRLGHRHLLVSLYLEVPKDLSSVVTTTFGPILMRCDTMSRCLCMLYQLLGYEVSYMRYLLVDPGLLLLNSEDVLVLP